MCLPRQLGCGAVLPLDHLRHILAEAEYLGGQVKRLSREQFLKDETAKRAFARSIEVIGEAVKQLPDDIRTKYPKAEGGRALIKRPNALQSRLAEAPRLNSGRI
ncbi:MAG: DUF86 domain-containing protein [Verrucomicrobiota bacterium]|nr:DUF86 domain-containing protein [Verrucomicrobiota bacterium]